MGSGWGLGGGGGVGHGDFCGDVVDDVGEDGGEGGDVFDEGVGGVPKWAVAPGTAASFLSFSILSL